MPKPTIEDYNKALATILEYIAETVVSRVNSKMGTRKAGGGNSKSGDSETLRKLKFRIRDLVDKIGKEQAYAELEQKNAFYSQDSGESDLKNTIKVLEALIKDDADDDGDVDTAF